MAARGRRRSAPRRPCRVRAERGRGDGCVGVRLGAGLPACGSAVGAAAGAGSAVVAAAGAGSAVVAAAARAPRQRAPPTPTEARPTRPAARPSSGRPAPLAARRRRAGRRAGQRAGRPPGRRTGRRGSRPRSRSTGGSGLPRPPGRGWTAGLLVLAPPRSVRHPLTPYGVRSAPRRRTSTRERRAGETHARRWAAAQAPDDLDDRLARHHGDRLQPCLQEALPTQVVLAMAVPIAMQGAVVLGDQPRPGVEQVRDTDRPTVRRPHLAVDQWRRQSRIQRPDQPQPGLRG